MNDDIQINLFKFLSFFLTIIIIYNTENEIFAKQLNKKESLTSKNYHDECKEIREFMHLSRKHILLDKNINLNSNSNL